jgi:hypothetical protein
MHARRSISGILLAAGLALVAGCGTTATPTTPTTTPTITDTFTADLAQQGSITHNFKVNSTGQVTITLTTVTPLASMSLGVGMMTSDGTSCIATLTQNDNARANNAAALEGTAVAGNYCIRVYDSGNVPASTTVNYTLTVLHP